MSSAMVKVDRAEVVPLEPSTMDEAWGLSDRLAKAYVIPEHLRNKPSDVFAMVLYGRELGMTPMQSLVGIYSLKGRPGLYAETAVALVKSSPLCKYFMSTETTEQRATFETLRVGDPKPQAISFTIEQARQAGLMSNPTWKNYPSEMLRARAAIELCRLVYPDVCKGMARLPEELDEEEIGPAETIKAPAPPKAPPRRADGPTPETRAKFDAEERQGATAKPARAAVAPPASDAGPDPRAKAESGGPPAPGARTPPAPATAPREGDEFFGDATPPKNDPEPKPAEPPRPAGGEDVPAEPTTPGSTPGLALVDEINGELSAATTMTVVRAARKKMESLRAEELDWCRKDLQDALFRVLEKGPDGDVDAAMAFIAKWRNGPGAISPDRLAKAEVIFKSRTARKDLP